MKYNKIKNVLCIIFILTVIQLLQFNFLNCVYATDDDDADFVSSAKKIYNVDDINNSTELNARAGNFIWLATAAGIVTGVCVIAWTGVKFIISSPEGKAEIKKQAFMYILGATLIISGSVIIKAIADVADVALNN